ncbi:MAG: hypothetical protein HN509_16125 [Halobacteriovoraceae bacterium]|nr:hypothetical protein [Halobacteriovoraceae bacterium]
MEVRINIPRCEKLAFISTVLRDKVSKEAACLDFLDTCPSSPLEHDEDSH